jgi:hypothetical protein
MKRFQIGGCRIKIKSILTTTMTVVILRQWILRVAALETFVSTKATFYRKSVSKKRISRQRMIRWVNSSKKCLENDSNRGLWNVFVARYTTTTYSYLLLVQSCGGGAAGCARLVIRTMTKNQDTSTGTIILLFLTKYRRQAGHETPDASRVYDTNSTLQLYAVTSYMSKELIYLIYNATIYS